MKKSFNSELGSYAKINLEILRKIAVRLNPYELDGHSVLFDSRSEKQKLLSVIVATYNRPVKLIKCVTHLQGALAEQSGVEIIIVDDGSATSHQEILARLSEVEDGIELLLVQCPHRGQAKTKNSGVAFASADVVAFVDDDIYVESMWAKEALRTINKGADVVTGSVRTYPEDNNLFSDLVHLRSRDVSLRTSDQYRTISNLGGIICIQRRIFLLVDGYDDRAINFGANMGTDIDLTWRLNNIGGVRMAFNPKMVSWLYERNTLRSFWRQKFKSGYSLQFYLLLYKRDPLEINQPQNRSEWHLLWALIRHLNIFGNVVYLKRNYPLKGWWHAFQLGCLLSIKRIAKDSGALMCIFNNKRKIGILQK